MNESFGAGGFDANTTGTQSGVQSETKAEGIVPLVIKQIKLAPDTGFTMYGMSFGMVTLVGIVREIEHSSTKIKYVIEDFTGQIEAHLWLEEGDTANTPSLLLNTYARLQGSIRSTGGVSRLMVFKIEQLPSINDLTTHLLEVLNSRYMAEDFSKSNGGGGNAGSYSTGNADTFNSNNGFDNGTSSNGDNGLKGKHLLIFDAVRNNKSDTGISLQELQKKFTHINPNEILQITEYMTNEGHIYTSIDSEHFLPTDA